jgi:hypothetical protein
MEADEMSDNDLLDTQGAADYLTCSKSLLDKLRVRGGGPVFSILGDRLIRYTKPNLDKYIAERNRKSTSDPGVLPPRRRRSRR